MLAILGSEPVEAIAEAIEAHPEAYTELKIIEKWMAQMACGCGSFSLKLLSVRDELGADGSELALKWTDSSIRHSRADPQVIELYLRLVRSDRLNGSASTYLF